MDIDKIALKIFSEKPKPKFTIQLNIDINSDINQQFEIIALIFLRGINEKINNEYLNIDNVKELKKIIQKQLFLLKIYFNSFALDFKFSNLEKKNCTKYNFSNSPYFYNKNKYNFDFCFLKNIYRKGRLFETSYNYNTKSNSLNEIFTIIKIKNHYFKISFDFLKN